ncbi:MAG: hypothetical protein PHP08_00640 [Candidatus Dojkabacteria bacterium]|nr:hypothetical protein [Candidatus Dojkabacteria bacterium]
MPERYSTYLRDLMCRQNKPVTESQIHLYLSSKKYYKDDIDDAIRKLKRGGGFNLSGVQHDLNGNISNTTKRHPRTEIEELHEELLNKEEELKETEEELNEIKLQKLFVYQKKLILLDDEKNILILKYKEDLFDDLIHEFTKLYDWLDNRGSYLKFNDENENSHVIDKTEIKTVIHFFDKLNKIKKD